jgi:hypothetical protein
MILGQAAMVQVAIRVEAVSSDPRNPSSSSTTIMTFTLDSTIRLASGAF